jgi:small-conductance mechanosensitive channel
MISPAAAKPPTPNLIASLQIWKIFLVGLLIAGAWALLKWTRTFVERLEKGNPRLRFLLQQIQPPFRIAIWFVTILAAADILAPSQEAFLALLGSAALAIGLGLQDLLKSLIGGLVIVVDRPFQIGDRIKLGDTYGEVKHIGLRSVKIQQSNGMLVTVPNSEAITRFIYNANGGVPESIVSVDVGLSRKADTNRVISICKEVAVCCPYTHLGRDIKVKLREDTRKFRTIVVTIQAYVYDHRFESAMKTELLRRVNQQFLAKGMPEGLS